MNRPHWHLSLASRADAAAVAALRIEAYRAAREFRWRDEARLHWGPVDDDSCVLALRDTDSRLASSVRLTVLSDAAAAERMIEHSLAGLELAPPVLVLSRSASHPQLRRQGGSGLLRQTYLAAFVDAPPGSVVTQVYDGAPRLAGMLAEGFELHRPRASWDSEAEATSPPLIARLRRERFAAAAAVATAAQAHRLADAAIDREAIADGLRRAIARAQARAAGPAGAWPAEH